jgi:hypothetical protein
MDKDLIASTPYEVSKDQVIDFSKTVLPSIFPIAGNVASVLLGAIPNSRQKRFEEFLLGLNDELNKLQLKMGNLESIIKGIQDQLEYIIEKVIFTPNRQKMQIYKSIFLNEIIGTSLSEDVKEYFINIVETKMSMLQIKILSFMNNPSQYLLISGIPEDKIFGSFTQFFPIVFPDVPIEVIKAAYKDLFDIGFINTDVTIFGTMTSAQGLQLLGNRVKVLGKMFIRYCTYEDK